MHTHTQTHTHAHTGRRVLELDIGPKLRSLVSVLVSKSLPTSNPNPNSNSATKSGAVGGGAEEEEGAGDAAAMAVEDTHTAGQDDDVTNDITTGDSNGDGDGPSVPDSVRAFAFVALGKFCLLDKTLAKESVTLLVRELSEGHDAPGGCAWVGRSVGGWVGGVDVWQG